MKTSNINIEIESDLKEKVESILNELGLSSAQAINIFFRQVALQKGLPFIVRIPNQDTADAVKESRVREGLASYNSPDDLFDDLGI